MFDIQFECWTKHPRHWAAVCTSLFLLLLLYNDPFLILWWPQTAAKNAAVLPLDMAADCIDDMYHGCRSEVATLMDVFGVFEWHLNRNFSYAWALTEKYAKRPVHERLIQDHSIAVFMFTKFAFIRNIFNKAVKTGKHKYNTDGFKYHYLYFYLTDTIQALHGNHSLCRSVYLRTWKRFEQNIVDTNMRFGTFTWAAADKRSFEANGNISCFAIDTCFGADISYYSSTNHKGQVLIPPYEVFKITGVRGDDPWCTVVYKLQSTRAPKAIQNCKLKLSVEESLVRSGLTGVYSPNVLSVAVCAVLLMINSYILVRQKQKRYVAVVMCGLLLVIAVATVSLAVT